MRYLKVEHTIEIDDVILSNLQDQIQSTLSGYEAYYRDFVTQHGVPSSIKPLQEKLTTIIGVLIVAQKEALWLEEYILENSNLKE